MKWTALSKKNSISRSDYLSKRSDLVSHPAPEPKKDFSESTTLFPDRSCWSHQTLPSPRLLFRAATVCCHNPHHRHPAGDDEMGSSEALLCRPEMEFLNGIFSEVSGHKLFSGSSFCLVFYPNFFFVLQNAIP